MIRAGLFTLAVSFLGLAGCTSLKPKVGLTYDLFSNQAKLEFSLAPGSKGKSVVPTQK
jgi:hypothetical protein